MQRIEHSFLAMGGPCRIRIDCESAALARQGVAAAEAEVRRLEARYSRYLPDSLTSQINRLAGTGEEIAIDSETAGLLNYAQTLWQESDGLFDLTSGVLRKAWDFKSSRLPTQSEIDRLLPLVAWDAVQWSQAHISLPNAGMELDFGGCVKEYACDAAAAELRELGVRHALADLAGDMAAVGGQGVNGDPWLIGIRDPAEPARALAQLPLSAGGLASSGNYERAMVIGGRHFGHILNPKTGWPVEGLTAVSVLAEQCLVAGSSATIAMLMPSAEALLWLEGLGLPWLAVDTQFNRYGTVS